MTPVEKLTLENQVQIMQMLHKLGMLGLGSSHTMVRELAEQISTTNVMILLWSKVDGG